MTSIRIVIVFACLIGSACTGDSVGDPITGPTPVNTGGGAPSGGGAPPGGTTSGGGTTGLRSVICSRAGAYETARWLEMPRLEGFDVKIHYNGVFEAAMLNFRNRYQDRIHFSYRLYPFGLNPPPRTNARHSMSAGRQDTGPIGYGSANDVGRGGEACVVIDQVRFGASDSGPYYNP